MVYFSSLHTFQHIKAQQVKHNEYSNNSFD